MPLVQATDVPSPVGSTLVRTPDLPNNLYQGLAPNANVFGALEGAAAEQFGQTLERASGLAAERAIDLQKIHNSTVVENANTQFMKETNDDLFGTPGKPGYYATKGMEAQYKYNDVKNSMDAREKNIMASLQNDAQRLAFQHETRYQRRWMERDIASHYQKETTKANEAALEGAFAVATNVAGKNYHDDERTRDAFLAADALAVSKGLGDPAATEAYRQKFRDQVYVERVTGYAAQEDWTGARAFLDKNMSYISDARVRKTLNDMVNDKAIAADINSFYAAGSRFLGPPPKTGGGAFSAPAGPLIAGASPQEQQLLNEVRFRESSHNYSAIGPTILTGRYQGQTAKGAYGFLDETWAEATRATGLGKEFATADQAPPAVQDANALWLYRNRGTAPWAASGPYPGAATVEQRQGGATRNLPISTRVNVQLERASAAVGDLKVEVFSGGQPSSGPNRVGSHRHDEGEAADIQLRDVKTGKLLDMRVPEDRARMQKFITEAVAAGATGVGAAENYMGPNGIHIGGGTPAVWGADGTGATAPDWVRAAWEAGRLGTPRVAASRAGGTVDLAPVPNFTGAVLGAQGPAYAPATPGVRVEPLSSEAEPAQPGLGVGGALMARPVPTVPLLATPVGPLVAAPYFPPPGAPATPPPIPGSPPPVRDARADMAAIAARYPNPTDQVKALEAYQHRFNAENAILQQEHRARVELSDQALAEYVARIARGEYAGVLEDIQKGTDKRLLGTTSHTIYEMALAERRRADEKWPKTLGPGFYDVLQRITNDERAADRITDTTQIYSLAGPSNWLTIQGANQLAEILTSKSKTSAGQADAMYFDQLFKAAHARLTFTGLEDLGIHDPDGEMLHSKFIHQALPEITRLKKEGKSMAEITDLDKGPLKPLLDSLIRSPATVFQNWTVRRGQMGTVVAPGATPGPGAAPGVVPGGAVGPVLKYDRSGNPITAPVR